MFPDRIWFPEREMLFMEVLSSHPNVLVPIAELFTKMITLEHPVNLLKDDCFFEPDEGNEGRQHL